MKRRTHLNLEMLEGRALLSGVAYSLTTNQSVYQPGQPIEMTFQETNVSDHAISVGDGPSIDGFTVVQGGAVVWRSNAGINPLFIRLDPLQPGQSLTLTATWDGVPTGGSSPSSGTFVIDNQLNPQAASATVTIAGSTSPSSNPTPPKPTPRPVNPVATAPAPVSASPAPGSSSIAVTVSTDHPTYRKGHQVRMTLTLQDVGNSPVVLPINSADRFTVLKGSTAVWSSARIVSGVGSVSLEPGQSITATALWNGRAKQAGVTITPGTYTLQASDEGYSGSTTFRIIS
jgi:hypothetical protein